jgi:hypothetical protein
LEEVSQESEKRICEEVTVRMQKEMNYLLLQKEELHEKQVALLREILAQVKTEKKKKEPQEVPGSQKPESEVAATVEGAGKTAGGKKEERPEKQGKKRRKKKLFAKSVS